MRKVILILVAMLLTATFAAADPSSQLPGGGNQNTASALPSSLDSFYPPRAEGPYYLFEMLKLDTLFSGIAADVMEGDLPGAVNSFGEFESQYRKVSQMVPEWEGYYSMAMVQRLGKELKKGGRDETMAAFGEVGKSCHQCHIAKMVPAQQRYHWGRFAEITVLDPLSRQQTEFASFKKYLSTNMAGITVNLMQGQVENARRQFDGFRARFETLKGSCLNCHDDEMAYFVDGGVEKLLDDLNRALSEKKVDPGTIGTMIQGVGRESCFKCHLVHVPAALSSSNLR
jgi:cytochrome c556